MTLAIQRRTAAAHPGQPLPPIPEDVPLGRLADLLALRMPLPHAALVDLFGELDVAARATGGHATVVDVNPYFLDACRERSAAAGLALVKPEAHRADVTGTPTLTTVLSDACIFAASRLAGGARAADLVACVGARPWGAGGVPASTEVLGDRAATLAALRGLTRPGGLVLIGEEFYHRAPDAELQALLGGDQTDFTFGFDDQLALAAEHGLEVVHALASTEAELRAYDGAFHDAIRAFTQAHPGDPDTPRFRERLDTWCAPFARNPETLGFGWFLLRRPD